MTKKILIEKVCDLDEYSHTAINHNNFPRYERLILCTTILKRIDEIREYSIRIYKGYTQKSTLINFDIALEQLRMDIRKSYGMRYIGIKRCDTWINKIDEIGNIVGGFIKKQMEEESKYKK